MLFFFFNISRSQQRPWEFTWRRWGSHLCVKAVKLESWASVLLPYGFVKLQACISRKTLAESTGWNKFWAALQPVCVVFLGGRVGVPVCACPPVLQVTHMLCPFWQLFAQLLGYLPNSDKTWYVLSPGTERQRGLQKMRLNWMVLEAGVWDTEVPHSYLHSPLYSAVGSAAVLIKTRAGLRGCRPGQTLLYTY